MEDDLGTLQVRHLGRYRVGHVGVHVHRIDVAEAGGMQVDQVIEAPDDTVHEPVRIDLGDITVGFAGHDVVEVDAVVERPFVVQEGRHVHHDDRDDRAAQRPGVDRFQQAVDDRNPVDLVAVHDRRQAEHRAVAFAAHRHHRQAHRPAHRVVNEGDEQPGADSPGEMLDLELLDDARPFEIV